MAYASVYVTRNGCFYWKKEWSKFYNLVATYMNKTLVYCPYYASLSLSVLKGVPNALHLILAAFA